MSSNPPRRILIVQPSWVGDAIMATPALRDLRRRYPNAHVAYLVRRYVREIYTGMPWPDRIITYRTDKGPSRRGRGMFNLAARLRAGRFDTALLLSNSFRTALVCRLAGIPRIIGYDRDYRHFLLTDRLAPLRRNGKFVPTPIVKSYLELARYLEAEDGGKEDGGGKGDLQLFITPSEKRDAGELLVRCGLEGDLQRPAAGALPPLILLNPGAKYGAAKCWLPKHFAMLADRFIEELGATVLISAAPGERRIVELIVRHMQHAPVDLSNKGLSLGTLKEIVRRCDLMVTNDTGPRHIAAAVGIPVVTIFGPTHRQWTEIDYPAERQIAIKVDCGPCQRKLCPLDHRCMTGISAAMVFDAAIGLLNGKRSALPVLG